MYEKVNNEVLETQKRKKMEHEEEVFSAHKAYLGDVGSTCVWTPKLLKDEKE